MIKWETMPAVSSNRNFYVSNQGEYLLSVVFDFYLGKWTAMINHNFQASFSTAARAKRYFEN